MAIQLEKTMYNGTVTAYHRIGFLEVDCLNLTFKATVESFADREERANRPSSIYKTYLAGPINSIETALADAYTYAMTTPEFLGGVMV